MGITAFPFSSVIDVPTARILGRDDAGTGSAEALTNTEIFAILGTGTPSASTYLRGDGTWSTVSAGVGGSTGIVDNAVLRADGTGGATLQASAVVIPDNYTASPNATVNHASIQATGATTNVSVSVAPKGTGSFSLHVPDGTATGGNARGANAVDLQTIRAASTQVASGAGSFCGSGFRNTVSGVWAGSVGGALHVLSADQAFVGGGESCTVTGQFAGVIAGWLSQAVDQYAFAMGMYANARLKGMFAHSSNPLAVAVAGQNQSFRVNMGCKTTSATPVSMRVDKDQTQRLTVVSGTAMRAAITVVGMKSDGSALAVYERRVTIKNVAGVTSLVGTVQTIGTDYEDNASTDISITANDTNDALDITVTGIANETWRWFALVDASELAYGT